MVFSSLIGLLLSFAVLFLGLYLSSPTHDISMFVSWVSFFIVFGGTFAATALSFKIERLFLLITIFIRKVFFKSDFVSYAKIIEELMILSETNRANPNHLPERIEKLNDPFLKDAMITFTDQVLDKEGLIRVLRSRAGNIYQHYLQDALKFKAIAKFPPAFGMMGTTIGMIVLLASLDSGAGVKSIGPAMGICLITTLYGVALANLFVIPIAEYLYSGAKEQYFKNNIIAEGVKLIYEKTNPVELAEILNAYLRPGERINWKQVLKNKKY